MLRLPLVVSAISLAVAVQLRRDHEPDSEPWPDDLTFDHTGNWSHECLQQFSQLSSDVRSSLNDPAMMCLQGLKSRRSLSSMNNLKTVDKPGPQTFTQGHAIVGGDPVHKREHIIVVGPESSGTHFLHEVVAATFNISQVRREFAISEDATVLHISEPEGTSCAKSAVSILDDFGVKPGHFALAGQQKQWLRSDISWPWGKNSRFFVDVVSLVRQYKARGESVKVLQVIRDPEIAMVSKIRYHCDGKAELGDRANVEQAKAFKFMADAKDLPEVTTVCYEEMVEQGSSYIKRMLTQMGLNIDHVTLPEFQNGNAKHQQDRELACDSAAEHYMQLCPSSPHTLLLKQKGCGQSPKA